MKHYGDICEIRGDKVPLVDIVTGGSPCQDLSVAGRRAGLSGERSGLFMEQIRLIKEMRDECVRQLQMRGADVDIRYIRPRYMVWENVPGAFSSNQGEDFRCVLEETARIVDKDAIIPRPKGKWTPSGAIMGNGWSIAWRVHDAQFWGVPQRRKRISLVADFGGDTAPEILFERKSLSRDTQQSGEERETTSTAAEGNFNPASYTLKVRGGREVDSYGKKAGKGALIQTELSGTLGVSQDQTLISYGVTTKGNGDAFLNPDTHTSLSIGGGQAGQGYPCVMEKCLNPWDVQSKHIQPEDGKAEALYAGECRGGGGESYVLSENSSGGDIAGTLDSSYYKGCGERQGIEREVVCIEGNGSRESHNGDGYKESDIMYTLNTVEQHGVCMGIDRASFNQGKNAQFDFSVEEEKAQTLVSKGPGGGTNDTIGALCARDFKGVGNQYVNEGKCIIQFNNRDDT